LLPTTPPGNNAPQMPSTGDPTRQQDHCASGTEVRCEPSAILSRTIAFSGGHRCKQPGCPNSSLISKPDHYCRQHGGFRKCKHEGCTKNPSTLSKPPGYCAEHAASMKSYAGRNTQQLRREYRESKQCSRCPADDKHRAAVPYTNGLLCIRCGGGYRCQTPGCATPSEEQTSSSKHCKIHSRELKGESFNHGNSKNALARHYGSESE